MKVLVIVLALFVIQATTDKTEQQLEALTEELNALKKDVREQNELVQNQQSLINQLYNMVNNHESMMTIFQQDSSAQKAQLEYLESDLEILQQNQIEDIDDIVAFSAYPTADIQSYTDGQRIRFDGVNYNSGNYSAGLSEFRCWRDGLYYFTINMRFLADSDAEYNGHVEVLRAGNRIMRLDADSGAFPFFLHASNSIIVSCNPGDRVFVRSIGDNKVYGVEFSHFTGILLAYDFLP